MKNSVLLDLFSKAEGLKERYDATDNSSVLSCLVDEMADFLDHFMELVSSEEPNYLVTIEQEAVGLGEYLTNETPLLDDGTPCYDEADWAESDHGAVMWEEKGEPEKIIEEAAKSLDIIDKKYIKLYELA